MTVPIRTTMLPLPGQAGPQGAQVCLGTLIMIPGCHQLVTDAWTSRQGSTFPGFYSTGTGLPSCRASERDAADSRGTQSFAVAAQGSRGSMRTCGANHVTIPEEKGPNTSTKKSDHPCSPRRKARLVAWVREAIDGILEPWS